eukprot:9083575-Pyramimonas_sp.AAC.1
MAEPRLEFHRPPALEFLIQWSQTPGVVLSMQRGPPAVWTHSPGPAPNAESFFPERAQAQGSLLGVCPRI